jgi:hypothetical protein
MATERLTFEMNAVGNAVPQMQKVQQQLGNVNRQMTQTTQVMQRHTRATHQVVRSNMGLTRGLGLASLQFQDMAVQASMGTDALRIMTMQGPQLASIFGPKGMIIGGIIAVGGAIAMMGKSAKSVSFDFKQFFADIKPAFEGLRPILDGLKIAFDAVKEALIFSINAIINALQAMATVAGTVLTRLMQHLEIAQLRAELVGTRVKKFMQQVKDAARLSPELSGLIVEVDGIQEQQTKVEALTATIALLEDAIFDAGETMDKNQNIFKQIFTDLKGMEFIDIRKYFKMVDKANKDAIEAMQKRTQAFADTMKSTLEEGFMAISTGTKSVKDAFRSMARDIIAQLYKVLVVQRLVGSFNAETGVGTGLVGMLMKSIPSLPANAMGGPVTGGRATIVGERGPEILVPHRSGHIIPNNKLGGQGLVINQYNNFQEGVSRSEIQSMLPKIVEASKSAVLDARRRGGSYSAAFG